MEPQDFDPKDFEPFARYLEQLKDDPDRLAILAASNFIEESRILETSKHSQFGTASVITNSIICRQTADRSKT
jgi:hypothetical protein